MQQKYYLVYQITNLINNFIYIGIHITNDINDKYMGSGSRIKQAILEFGVENFKREILFIFDNKEDMYNKEIELVNKEFVARSDTYNSALGGKVPYLADTIPVKGLDGKYFRVHRDDERWINGELVHDAKGTISAKDKNGIPIRVSKDDPRWLSGELVGIRSGHKNGEKQRNSTKLTWTGRKHKKESIDKMKLALENVLLRQIGSKNINWKGYYKLTNNQGINLIFTTCSDLCSITGITSCTCRYHVNKETKLCRGKWSGFKIYRSKNFV